MMRILRLTVPLCLLLAAAACGATNNDGTVAGAGLRVAPGTEVTSAPVTPPSGPPPTAANTAQPDSRVVDARPIPWTSVQAGPDRQLLVHYTVGGPVECSTLRRIDLIETTDAVTVTVLVGRLPDAHCGGPQIEIAAAFVTTVTLREPLGTRVTHDGAH
jgi:hypothetical protein